MTQVHAVSMSGSDGEVCQDVCGWILKMWSCCVGSDGEVCQDMCGWDPPDVVMLCMVRWRSVSGHVWLDPPDVIMLCRVL